MRASTRQETGNSIAPRHTFYVSLGTKSLWKPSQMAVATGIAAGYGRFLWSAGPIPLDFSGHLTDSSYNTLAAPLLRTAMSHHNDVHQGRVLFMRLPNLKGPQ